ncbi:MAG: hypothetical protein AB7N76_24685 [Planctomycetota bacterium]
MNPPLALADTELRLIVGTPRAARGPGGAAGDQGQALATALEPLIAVDLVVAWVSDAAAPPGDAAWAAHLVPTPSAPLRVLGYSPQVATPARLAELPHAIGASWEDGGLTVARASGPFTGREAQILELIAAGVGPMLAAAPCVAAPAVPGPGTIRLEASGAAAALGNSRAPGRSSGALA